MQHFAVLLFVAAWGVVCFAEYHLVDSIGHIDEDTQNIDNDLESDDTVDTLLGELKEVLHLDEKQFNRGRYSVKDQDVILEKHRALRAGVSPIAADMKLMNLDTKLTKAAQAWSNKCTWKHGNVKGASDDKGRTSIGQNLWMGGYPGTPSGVVQAWYNENKYYTYCTRHCSNVCGHYTQVVWAKSERVGCARAFCPKVRNKYGVSRWKNKYIVTCNYSPPGNYRGALPYSLGPKGGKCQKGYLTTKNGICASRQQCEADKTKLQCGCKRECQNCGSREESTCTCNCKDGWDGLSCERKCDNWHRWCGRGWYKNWCVAKRPYVVNNCRELCGFCKRASSKSTNRCCAGKECQRNNQILNTDCGCITPYWDICNGGSGLPPGTTTARAVDTTPVRVYTTTTTTISSPTTNPGTNSHGTTIFSCDFDNGMCGFRNTSRNKWTRNRYGTPSCGTGPRSGHTDPDATSKSDFYMYMETSKKRPGAQFILQSPLISVTGHSCLSFYYYGFGTGLGRLNVRTKLKYGQAGQLHTTVDKKSSPKWRGELLDINESQPFQVVFEGIRGKNYKGDYAIDDIVITKGQC